METTLGTIIKEKPGVLYSVAPEASVQEAVNVMVEGGVGCVMVMKQGRLEGLFTERDLMHRVVGREIDPSQITTSEVMTREIATVSPKLTVGEAMALCTEKRLRHLPVYEGETLIGMVSSGDLTKYAVSEQQHTIEDLIKYISG
ncbi:CBS domain-containing protein [Ectothiorhodospiraceae bacterium WFHF3C12]|nr:CBS domain-containing protein [Ectothiorhodospiraceae bacterium WFHF3C12]